MLIQERIDRFFVNPLWYTLHPEARVKHHIRCHSDHCLVLLETNPVPTCHLLRSFKFHSFWLLDSPFPRVVQQAWNNSHHLLSTIANFSREATSWNREHFGNIFGKKRKLLARLDGIQRALGRGFFFLVNLERDLLGELDFVLK